MTEPVHSLTLNQALEEAYDTTGKTATLSCGHSFVIGPDFFHTNAEVGMQVYCCNPHAFATIISIDP